MDHICIFRHALALDEHRVKFLPEYAFGGEGPEGKTTSCDIKEVWFAGSHSDMYVHRPFSFVFVLNDAILVAGEPQPT